MRNRLWVLGALACVTGTLVIGLPAAAAAPSVGAASVSRAAVVPLPEVMAFVKAGSIYTAHIDGTGQRLVVRNAGEPLLSPNGTRLAYRTSTGVYRSLIDGHNPILIDTVAGHPVAWSPDNLKILLNEPAGLVVLDLAGHRQPIPDTAGAGTGPAAADDATLFSFGVARWSPDGTLIAFNRGDTQVLVRPDGSSRSTRTGFLTGSWSPDGSSMLGRRQDPDTLIRQDVITGDTTLLSSFSSSFALADAVWRADDNPCEVVEHLSGAPEPGISGLGCDPGVYPAFFIQDATSPTFGGIPRPADPDGTPPAVDGLVAVPGANSVGLTWTGPVGTPDVAGVEVRYALGAVAPSSVSAGSDGGRLLGFSRTITGLAANQQVSVSVFSRDWHGHVGPGVSATVTTPAYDGTTLTAHGVPYDFAYGTRSTVSGRLTDAHTGAGLAGASLAITRRIWGTTDPFVGIGSVTTHADGTFSFQQVPSVSYDYLIRYAGTPIHFQAQAGVRLRVFRRLTVVADHPRSPAGSEVHLTAATAPPLVEGKTYLYLKDALGTPRLLGPHNTDSAGRVTYLVHAPARGTTAVYVVGVPGTGHFINSWTSVSVTGT